MAKKVLVGMSGGVDSAACVLLLQKQGYDVSGVTLRLHHYKDRPGTCGSADDIEEAARVAAQMGVSHRVLDLCDLFRREVMGHFVSEYCAGRTPNPCLDCNRELKFGAMLDWALDHGFDYVSTGHYARVGFDAASGRHLLLRGVDAHKDQSYVLYQMTQRQLAHLLLPVGEYSKPEIRALAADFGLENAQKPDSQDICFVPDGDYVRFLREFGGVTPEPGDFVDTSGRVLGRHRGLVAYTAGQRKGLGVSADRPLYVLSKDAKHNTVLLGDDAELDRHAARRAAARHRQNALFPARKRRDRHAAGRRRGPRGLRRAAARHHRGAGRGLLPRRRCRRRRDHRQGSIKTKNAPPAFLP